MKTHNLICKKCNHPFEVKSTHGTRMSPETDVAMYAEAMEKEVDRFVVELTAHECTNLGSTGESIAC